MAYAEKRGKSWRVCYQRPDATYATQSGFETKQAALAWGRDQESAIRRGDWTDPRGGQIALAEWVETWWPAQDVSVTTMSAYRWEIDSFILPAFGDRALASLTTEEIPVLGGLCTWQAPHDSRRRGPAAHPIQPCGQATGAGEKGRP
jgi:hypothetical protein